MMWIWLLAGLIVLALVFFVHSRISSGKTGGRLRENLVARGISVYEEAPDIVNRFDRVGTEPHDPLWFAVADRSCGAHLYETRDRSFWLAWESGRRRKGAIALLQTDQAAVPYDCQIVPIGGLALEDPSGKRAPREVAIYGFSAGSQEIGSSLR